MGLKDILNSNRPAESRQLACALTFCGGFIDAYTYIQRGHTLSAGQTGNVIFSVRHLLTIIFQVW